MRPAFYHNPPIQTYQCNAYALGALMALGEAASGVLDNNYVTWEFRVNFSETVMPIVFLPHISPPTFARCGLGQQTYFQATNRIELASAIASSLERGFLVRLIVDEYYVPDRLAYRSQHKMHDVLVIGASADSDHHRLIGYCSDRRFRESCCPTEALSEGYFGMVDRVGKAGFIAFKAELRQPVIIAPADIKRQLECFLQSSAWTAGAVEANSKPGDETLHGFAVLDACEEYVRKLSPASPQDRRIFSTVAEHSYMMLRRTINLSKRLGVAIDETASVRANYLAGRLKLLSLLPRHRRSAAMLDEMAKIFREIKTESKKAAEVLWATIDRHHG